MKNKYEFLLSLKLLEVEIKELNIYAKSSRECFPLLKIKLDYLCEFMNRDDNIAQWDIWGDDTEIKSYCESLREASVAALCDMEKYQSHCSFNNELDISDYMNRLSTSVRAELNVVSIDHTSKVLFIGAGAFPISALTIAKEIGAEVMGLDIDVEAVHMAKQLAKASGLDTNVQFSDKRVQELAFIKEATHIIIASLVKNKLEVLHDLKELVNPNAKIILRYGNGLKSIFNYPLENELSAEWAQLQMNNRPNKGIYDTLILSRSQRVASATKGL
ncbi:nicotianamine synthase family protein [Paenibacillus sp. 481]|uniref:nicotianamine synthase family protein n=1 Tax=Paenibacillus sp. 481 TaxID=2835869 RepID=UPI001E612723|nr:nicotianamine synthase family protein [Paenibacillus sp. 481]UHA73625.1 methyltransferase domain-containing protein [Paenibacillus sp. 481]